MVWTLVQLSTEELEALIELDPPFSLGEKLAKHLEGCRETESLNDRAAAMNEHWSWAREMDALFEASGDNIGN